MKQMRAAALRTLGLCLLLACPAIAEDGPTPPTIQDHEPKPTSLGKLANPAITESSGVTCSLRDPDILWTHNDSGDFPRLFAFDKQGRTRGVIRLTIPFAIDFEGMTAVVRHGQPYLVVADIGDNLKRRPYCSVYLIHEPKLTELDAAGEERMVRIEQAIHFRYADGPRDCEGVAFHPRLGALLFVTKERGAGALYKLPIPARVDMQIHVAERLGSVAVDRATGFGLSPDLKRGIMVNRRRAHLFTIVGDDVAKSLAQPVSGLPLEPARQYEAACFSRDGVSVFATSEGRGAPIWHAKLDAFKPLPSK